MVALLKRDSSDLGNSVEILLPQPEPHLVKVVFAEGEYFPWLTYIEV